MYLAVLTILAGWALLYASVSLVVYGIIVAVGFHLRVVVYEERRLKQQFGSEWEEYASRVPRWIHK